jgi:Fic family protein
MPKEFAILNKIAGALLSTQPAKELSTEVGKAIARGEPFDSERLKMLESLAIDLSKENFAKHPAQADKRAWFNFSFFEAYFSNYIEGTILTIEEAKEVIASKSPLPNKRDDSYDVLGTFTLTNDPKEMGTTPKTAQQLIDILQRRHSILLGPRKEKNPGMFKQRNNQAGSYEFVDHRLVPGTLKKSFKFYEYLNDPVARAFFVMFMVAEIHPFEDGNGRIARLMMNAELVAANLSKVIIPTVYRTDYLGALRAMSLRLNSIPFTRMLSRAFDFSATLMQPGFEDMLTYLRNSNAFESEEGVILRF